MSGISIRGVETITVVGSSGSGKTTLVDQFRDLPGIFVPQRVVTRPQRGGDNSGGIENVFVDHDTFEQGCDSGDIYPHWDRTLANPSRPERYGFHLGDVRQGDLVVLSGNNDFVRAEPDCFSITDESVLPVFLHASAITREDRIKSRVRSCDLDIAELGRRVGDHGYDVMQTVVRSGGIVLDTDRFPADHCFGRVLGAAGVNI